MPRSRLHLRPDSHYSSYSNCATLSGKLLEGSFCNTFTRPGYVRRSRMESHGGEDRVRCRPSSKSNKMSNNPYHDKGVISASGSSCCRVKEQRICNMRCSPCLASQPTQAKQKTLLASSLISVNQCGPPALLFLRLAAPPCIFQKLFFSEAREHNGMKGSAMSGRSNTTTKESPILGPRSNCLCLAY